LIELGFIDDIAFGIRGQRVEENTMDFDGRMLEETGKWEWPLAA
jgi:hypothetical protein